jgi:hypothetical protein
MLAIGITFAVAGVLSIVAMILFAHGEREADDRDAADQRWRAE